MSAHPPGASHRFATLALCGALAAPWCAQAGAQKPTQAGGASRRELVGRVRDSTGAPVRDVEVEVRGVSTRTLADGFFRLFTTATDTATISVRRLGFAPETAFVAARQGRWDTLIVVLRPVAQALDPMKIENIPIRMRAFEERRRRGLGVFVTRQEIAEHNSMQPSDALRIRRGIRLVRLRHGGYGVRFSMFSMRQNCAPALWVDGQRARDMELDDLSSDDIEGIELYDSFSITPFEFSRGDSELPCGTIVVWTRVPGR